MSYEPGLQWLSGLRVINRHTLSDFRNRNEQALGKLFERVIALPHMNRLITLERVTEDCTKIRAHLKLAREQKDRSQSKSPFPAAEFTKV